MTLGYFLITQAVTTMVVFFLLLELRGVCAASLLSPIATGVVFGPLYYWFLSDVPNWAWSDQFGFPLFVGLMLFIICIGSAASTTSSPDDYQGGGMG